MTWRLTSTYLLPDMGQQGYNSISFCIATGHTWIEEGNYNKTKPHLPHTHKHTQTHTLIHTRLDTVWLSGWAGNAEVCQIWTWEDWWASLVHRDECVYVLTHACVLRVCVLPQLLCVCLEGVFPTLNSGKKGFSLALYGCWHSTQVKVSGAWLYLCYVVCACVWLSVKAHTV